MLPVHRGIAAQVPSIMVEHLWVAVSDPAVWLNHMFAAELQRERVWQREFQ